MRYYGINWTRLKNKCPINITRIVKLARNIQTEMRNLNEEKDLFLDSCNHRPSFCISLQFKRNLPPH